MKILLAEPAPLILQALTNQAAAHRYTIDLAEDGDAAWAYGANFEYDLIIAAVELPKVGGIQLCQRFRSEGYTTSILLLSDQTSVSLIIQGLDSGADDYVIKPCDPAELLARIRALIRRGSSTPLPILAWGDLLLNLSTYEVSYNDRPVTLSPLEYELLELMLRDSQHVFSTDELIDRLWPLEQFPSEATVRSHIRRVRQKLSAVGAPKDLIATLHGRGYYLKAPISERSSVFVPLDVPSVHASKFNQPLAKEATYQLILFSQQAAEETELIRTAARYSLNMQLISLETRTSALLQLQVYAEQSNYHLDLIVFRLPTVLTEQKSAMLKSKGIEELWGIFEDVNSQHSDVPIAMISEASELRDRLHVMNSGGQLFLNAQNTPEQMSAALLSFLERVHLSKKVMIFDHDSEWLSNLQELLQPWDLKITTLAEVEQFWTVLQAVEPDILIFLAARSPSISSFELCKLLRSDPCWLSLPVLFLSHETDSSLEHQAFAAGADDYLYQPIHGAELANRILNRLQRRLLG